MAVTQDRNGQMVGAPPTRWMAIDMAMHAITVAAYLSGLACMHDISAALYRLHTDACRERDRA